MPNSPLKLTAVSLASMLVIGCSNSSPTPYAAARPAPAPLSTPAPAATAEPVAMNQATRSASQQQSFAPQTVANRPNFNNQPTPARSDRPISFALGTSLWGELAAPAGAAPSDASDNLRQASFTREGADFDIDVDPEAKFVVFASTRHQSTADIYLKSSAGNTVTKITSDPSNDVMPAISPDGRAIAFASDRAGNWDIYVQPVEGGQPIQLTNDPAQELHPDWSPDGSQLVFCSRGAAGQWEIVLIDVENPARRRIISFGLFPKFSPTGERIVFQRARARGSREFSVWTLDLVNGEGVRPTEIAAAANAAVINPTWSPDGRRIAFATVTRPSTDANKAPEAAELWAINIDGTERTKLTHDRYANLQPAWASDGTIYFISNRSGWDNVWAIRPAQAGSWLVRNNPERANEAQAEVNNDNPFDDRLPFNNNRR